MMAEYYPSKIQFLKTQNICILDVFPRNFSHAVKFRSNQYLKISFSSGSSLCLSPIGLGDDKLLIRFYIRVNKNNESDIMKLKNKECNSIRVSEVCGKSIQLLDSDDLSYLTICSGVGVASASNLINNLFELKHKNNIFLVWYNVINEPHFIDFIANCHLNRNFNYTGIINKDYSEVKSAVGQILSDFGSKKLIVQISGSIIFSKEIYNYLRQNHQIPNKRIYCNSIEHFNFENDKYHKEDFVL